MQCVNIWKTDCRRCDVMSVQFLFNWRRGQSLGHHRHKSNLVHLLLLYYNNGDDAARNSPAAAALLLLLPAFSLSPPQHRDKDSSILTWIPSLLFSPMMFNPRSLLTKR